jgi:hypothetical protein
MKKMLVFPILFLFVLCYITSAHAVPVVYDVTGTISITGSDDPLGWDGELFTFSGALDTDATPSYSTYIPANGHYITSYKPDTMTLIVDGNTYTATSSNTIWFNKYTDLSKDTFIMWSGPLDVGYPSTKLDLRVEVSYPFCSFGTDFPVPPVVSFPGADSVLSSKGEFLEADIEDDPTQYYCSNITLNASSVPEPATILLLGSGLVGLAGFGRKKIKK